MKRYSTTIGSRGRITLPQEIRLRLGIAPGDKVEFVCEKSRTVVRPLRPPGNPFEKYVGILGAFPGGKRQINAWVRNLRDEDANRK